MWMIRRAFSSTMLFFIHVRLCFVSARERPQSASANFTNYLSCVREREIQGEDREGQDLWKNVEVVQQIRVRMVVTCEVH
jgi:hypothetical protein